MGNGVRLAYLHYFSLILSVTKNPVLKKMAIERRSNITRETLIDIALGEPVPNDIIGRITANIKKRSPNSPKMIFVFLCILGLSITTTIAITRTARYKLASMYLTSGFVRSTRRY